MKVNKTRLTNLKIDFEQRKFITLMDSYNSYDADSFVSKMELDGDGYVNYSEDILKPSETINVSDAGIHIGTEGGRLEKLMEAAVKKEDYKSAAELRDRILELNKQ